MPLKLAKSQIDRLLVLLLLGAFSIACDRFIHISGHIRDATGRPIGRVSVKLFVTSANLTPQPNSPSDDTRHRSTSDDTGHYRVDDSVAPMRLSFLLVVEKEGYRPFQKALAEPPNPIENISLQPLNPTGKEALIEGHDVGNGLTLFVPKTSAETKYFPAISQVAKAAKLNDLRANPLPADESEVRIWTGFGKSPLKGYVIRRGKADFARLVQASSDPDNVTVSDLAPTDGDWFESWRKLTEEGLLSLPDFSQLPAGVDESGLKDSETIVFESSADGIYRVYYYPAVNAQTWPDAKRAVQIVKSLKTYYKLNWPK